MMKRLLSLLLCLISLEAFALDGKVTLTYGFFSIKADSAGKTASIANPYAFAASFQKPISKRFELSAGYSILLGDIMASDMGYGLNAGFHYFILSSPSEDVFESETITARRTEIWKPYVGIGFYQRNFQSIKNSYAGFGYELGLERYLNPVVNLKSEVRYINLAGASQSTASELDILIGIVFKF